MKGGQESVIQTNITLIFSNALKTKNFKKGVYMKKILVLLTAMLILLFGCDQITDDVSTNNTNQENNNGEVNNNGNQNQGNNEDNKDNQNGENEKTDEFTITLIGTDGEELYKLQVKSGKELSLPADIENILCWNTKADGTGESYSGTVIFSQNITLYAISQSEEKGFKVTFDANGTNMTVPEAIEFSTDKSVDLPNIEDSKFSHWNTSPDGSGDSYKGTAIFTQSVTLYAIPLPENSFKITYELNGGINNPANLYYFTEKDAPIYLKNPTKDGYTFGGWYETADFNNSKIGFLPAFNKEEGKLVFEDTTVYARWYDEATTIEVTSTDVASKISKLSDGVYTIKVTGAITSATIESIKTAMENNRNALIDLDLSETTGLTSIGEEAFADCINLTGITIPFGVTDINYYAFAWCDSLTNVILPNSVTSIGDSSFWGCRNLISINIPKSVTEVSYYAFIYCNSLTNFDISTNHKNFSTSDDGKSLYNKDKTELIAYPGATGNITILDGVTSIHGGIFNYNSDLTSVVIPDSVTSIDNNAFQRCANLTSVTIPESVTTIEEGAFSSCYNLVTFDVNVNNGKYSASDDDRILYNKDKTELIAYPSASGDVEIPEGTISIEKEAFADCPNLTSVIIPNSVTTIGDGAFEGCSNLTDITIGNGVISIGMKAFSYNPSLVNMIFKNTIGWCSKSIYNGVSIAIDVSDAVSIAADFVSGKYDEYYLCRE